MKIEINKPIALNEIGQRENNEDSLYPKINEASNTDSLFIVCDGVGGSAKGEVASSIVCNEIPAYFIANKLISSDESSVKLAVEKAETSIDKYLVENPMAHGMGTTLTLLHLHENGATIAWCGDSRVYQIRGEEILYKTIDHSFVNEMLKAGVITPEEAIDHPKKNVITRAIQGQSVKKAKVDVHIIDDIKKGDLFFLCSDGVLESFDDTKLVDLLSGEITLEQKAKEVKEVCEKNSKDNFTFYLVEVSKVTGKPILKSNKAEYIPTAQIADDDNLTSSLKPSAKRRRGLLLKKKYNKRFIVYLLIIIFSIVASLSLLFIDHDKPKEAEKSNIGIKPDHKVTSAPMPNNDSPSKNYGKITNNVSDDIVERKMPNSNVKKNDLQQDLLTRSKSERQPKSFSAFVVDDENIEIPRDKEKLESEVKIEKNIRSSNTYMDKRDGKIYKTVTITKNTWFAQNLNYELPGSECPEGFDCNKTGRYYSWKQANEACPKGWRLPSETEWKNLVKELNNLNEILFSIDYLGCLKQGTLSSYDETADFWIKELNRNEQPQSFVFNNKTKLSDKKAKANTIKKRSRNTYLNVRCIKAKN